MAEVLHERFIGAKTIVVKRVEKPSGGDKPYELCQEFKEYEVTTTEGKKIEQRDKRQFIRTIKTETYNKEAEIAKREDQKPSKKKQSKETKEE
jgi:hypothetical protein